MIKKVIQDAINKQIVRELYSSNLYLSMSAYYHLINLNGFANWMRIQAQEEMFHAMKLTFPIDPTKNRWFPNDGDRHPRHILTNQS